MRNPREKYELRPKIDRNLNYGAKNVLSLIKIKKTYFDNCNYKLGLKIYFGED